MKIKFAILTLTAILFVCSCNSDDVIYDSFTETKEGKWNETDTFENAFTIKDNSFQYNIYLNLRITNNYKYSNIYLQSSLGLRHQNNPFKRKHLLLATPEGKWLGSGKGEIITLQIPMYENVQFEKRGEYAIKMSQEMRDIDLENVVSAGIMVEKGNPVF